MKIQGLFFINFQDWVTAPQTDKEIICEGKKGKLKLVLLYNIIILLYIILYYILYYIIIYYI
jgi:hypothetical protein